MQGVRLILGTGVYLGLRLFAGVGPVVRVLGLCGADGVFPGIQGLIGFSTTGVVGLDRGHQSCF